MPFFLGLRHPRPVVFTVPEEDSVAMSYTRLPVNG